MVKCTRSGVEAEGLERPPFPGTLGERIYNQISKDTWSEWLKLQTMLINEHRLTPFESEAKAFLAQEREKFLFGGEDIKPEGYKPPA
jgi:Fe-S cluster biosynthesis and repair protein YggX